jgi:hypothetical protein
VRLRAQDRTAGAIPHAAGQRSAGYRVETR